MTVCAETRSKTRLGRRLALPCPRKLHISVVADLPKHSYNRADSQIRKGIAMSLASLSATGTKVWLDGVEPGDVQKNRGWGATGATSNPSIISDIIKAGKFDKRILELAEQGKDDDAIAWTLDDELVKSAQQVFL